jgi:succinoglycan biosynthesis protein ExoA
MDVETATFVTVIVPVRNEAKCIERTLSKLATQDYPSGRFEIIVADGRSTDDTAEIVARLQDRFANIILFDNPKRLSSAARNLGVRHGRGDYFIVIDGHCDIDDPLYLRKMVEAFQSSGADCLGRPQPLEITHASALQEAIALARRSWLGHNPSSHIYSSQSQFVAASSVAVAYRRSVFERVGEFDERFDACEDVEFNHRVDAAGLKCWFAPEIAVHYHPRSSIPGLMRQMARYGRGRLRLAAKHPRSLTLPAIAPLIFFLTMATCAALALAWPWFAAVVVSGMTKYVAVILIATMLLLPKPGRIVAKCWLPLVFLAIHLGYAWGTLREAMRLVLRGSRPASFRRQPGESSERPNLPPLTREARLNRAA